MSEEYSSYTEELQQKHSIEEIQHNFETEIANLISPSNEKGRLIFLYLERIMRQSRIQSLDPHDILVESYLRGLKFIQQTGEPIRTPQAWLRQTAYNIVKERVRTSVRDELTVEKLIRQPDNNYTKSPLAIVELSEQIELLNKALQKLSPSEQEIINLRVYSQMTYKEIQEMLEARDGKAVHLVTLRKRESRAIQKLREIFTEISELEPLSIDQ